MDPLINIVNISKQYRLGLVGTGTLSHDLRRWWHLVRSKEDPYLKIGETNDHSVKGKSDYVWALKDICFSVDRGEVLGIIGKNGAGKSTLLKILSRVTAPTTGSITYKGRIGSLLEVGTGFHPELTGRENIFLNGAILGMRKKEIDRKFDEIVDFSGCEIYIDTPVKRYSSGMTVRLAFAVAAFLEPEILIVDEVLAVGDAEFQKKAIGKMHDVSRNDGRTVLFVSHNMAAVKALCDKGMEIRNGRIVNYGDINSVIENYLEVGEIRDSKIIDEIKYLNNLVSINEFTINDSPQCNVMIDENYIKIKLGGILESSFRLTIEAKIYDLNGVLLCFFSPAFTKGIIKNFDKGEFFMEERILLPSNINKGKYILNIDLTVPGIEYIVQLKNKITLNFIKTAGSQGVDFNYGNSGFLILQ